MCGITGFINPSKTISDLKGMAKAIRHRGPDDEGYYFENGIGLAHTRLSILDLSTAGHQPMNFNEMSIVFNGEIYNFSEVQNELKKLGYSFDSKTDTEVILKAFDCWGPKCIEKFIGMFAFAIYCHDQNKLFLFRDRVGVKPLYYHIDQEGIAFSSDLRSFRSYLNKYDRNELDVVSISEYFTYGYINSNSSILKNVKKIPPGHYLIYENRNMELHRYWDASFSGEKNFLLRKEDDVLDELEYLIISSFKYRMVSDVPVGVFLSSGVDSSLVAAILSKHHNQIQTFTIGSEEKNYDESFQASLIADFLKTKHTNAVLTASKAQEIFQNFYNIYDEPHSDNSCIPATFVSEIAKNNGVKVVLSADGGDELFGGYVRYTQYTQRWDTLRKMGNSGKIFSKKYFQILKYFSSDLGKQKYERFINILGTETFINFYQTIIRNTSEQELNRMLISYTNPLYSYKEEADVNSQMMEWDFKRYLPNDILVKVDRATMYNGIEGREPFLDHRLIEFAARLPNELKIKNGQTKYLLRKLLSRYLPEQFSILPKRGFGAPVQKWMKERYIKEISWMLKNELFKNNYLNNNHVNKLMQNFILNKPVNKVMVWYIYSFQKWYNQWNQD